MPNSTILCHAGSSHVQFQRLDISDSASVEEFGKWAKAELRAVNVLVNNAGEGRNLCMLWLAQRALLTACRSHPRAPSLDAGLAEEKQARQSEGWLLAQASPSRETHLDPRRRPQHWPPTSQALATSVRVCCPSCQSRAASSMSAGETPPASTLKPLT